MTIDYLIIACYIVGMIGIGWVGMRMARTKSDFLVAGRRLGTVMYSGTMSAVVLGGASTIGGVGLGYKFGISGAWLVISIGLGILALSVFFARRVVRLKVYTVSEMVDLRYGGSTSIVSGVVMLAYTLMLAVTSTLAYSTIFAVLFDLGKVASVLLGGSIVVLYSVLGGMWSITLTDIVQFTVKTIGVLLLLLPIALYSTGGFDSLATRVPPGFFDFGHIGTEKIIAYLLTYTLGLLIGQDIWQRVLTARSDKVATAGGVACGVYCVIYGLAGALIGIAARSLYPHLASPDDAFSTIVTGQLPVGVRGLVLAAALAALMSTSSGALIACSTVAANDIWAKLRSGRVAGVHGNRLATLILGVITIVSATLLDSVVDALTVAYNLLVGGLLVTILGALLWKRATKAGALLSMTTGAATVVICMLTFGVDAVEPIYYGLVISFIAYVAGSLLTPAPREEELDGWTRRLDGKVSA
jgi:SSS family solute:Na+ symporter